MNAPAEKFLAAAAQVDSAAIQPLPNSRKVYVEGSRPDIRVPMREISQSDTPTGFGGEPNPPVTVYDCSGPYTDPDAQIIMPTVREDVAYSLKGSGLSAEEDAARVDATLERFRLAALADHPSHLLSGGEKQLLALAAVLIRDPDVVVMDEPTTLLDLRNTRMIGDVIAGLPHQVVLVTHHLDLLADFDRVLVFDAGRLVCDDRPDAALRHYVDLSR